MDSNDEEVEDCGGVVDVVVVGGNDEVVEDRVMLSDVRMSGIMMR